jgi:nucleotide-binding universal stress UspA family protein
MVEKKILLAVDESIHSKQAIQYAAGISSVVGNLSFTLFHVQPSVSLFLRDDAETHFKAKAELEKLVQKNAESALSTLETCKAQMVRMRIDEESVDVATQPRILGLAKDVMERANNGLYDAIVVGRRGLSRAQKAFMGSLTADLVEHSRAIPVWVVDGEVTSAKIMLAVDGSETSLRAVDHLSFMVGENPEIRITLFHVVPRIGDYCVVDFTNKANGAEKIITDGARRCIDAFYARAQKMFQEAGIQENQIDIKAVKRTAKVGKAIVEEAIKGDYGTIVVGRRGVDQSFFMGSVSRFVINAIANRALWIVS